MFVIKFLAYVLEHNYGHNLQLIVPYTTSTAGRRAFSVVGPKIFNNLPKDMRMIESTEHFKIALKTYLFKMSSYDIGKLYY